MTKLFFNLKLRDGSIIEDQTGVDYVDLAAAEYDALMSAREMIAEAVRHNVPVHAQELLAVSKSNEVAFTVDLDVCSKIDDLVKIRKSAQA